MRPKPAHLGPRYAAQFADESVARAYHTRPPYPPQLFDLLEHLLAPGPRVVLDLGCGTGDVALGLAARVERVDAVDPSRAMLDVARARPGASDPRLRWIASPAEAFRATEHYALVVAAESLHWMDWQLVFPWLATALRPGGFLALVSGRELLDVPWSAGLAPLVARYSTNREFRPYDLVDELSQRGLFVEVGRRSTGPVPLEQSVDDYIESFHTRNGFTRERMTARAARAFDEELRRLVAPHAPGGVIPGRTAATVLWGTPRSPEP